MIICYNKSILPKTNSCISNTCSSSGSDVSSSTSNAPASNDIGSFDLNAVWSCPFHCGRVEGHDGKRSIISPSDSSSVSESSADSVEFLLGFRPANNERSELENDRMCDLVRACDRVRGLEKRLEDDEEVPE